MTVLHLELVSRFERPALRFPPLSGGYSGVEDYRWEVLRSKYITSRVAFEFFNLTYISTFQVSSVCCLSLCGFCVRAFGCVCGTDRARACLCGSVRLLFFQVAGCLIVVSVRDSVCHASRIPFSSVFPLVQHMMIFGFVSPIAFAWYGSSVIPVPWGVTDTLATIACVFFLVFEVIADQVRPCEEAIRRLYAPCRLGLQQCCVVLHRCCLPSPPCLMCGSIVLP